VSALRASREGTLLADDPPSLLRYGYPGRRARWSGATPGTGGQVAATGRQPPRLWRGGSLETSVSWCAALQSLSLGSLQATAGSQALHGWMAGHYWPGVWAHVHPAALQLEADGYHGGRAEAHRLGRVEGLSYYLDIRSAYPWACATYDLPVRLGGYAEGDRGAGPDPAARGLELPGRRVPGDGPAALPVRRGPDTIYPVGRFRCVLPGPELVLARHLSTLHRVHRVAWYDCAPALRSYALAVHEARCQAERDGQCRPGCLLETTVGGAAGQAGTEGVALAGHAQPARPGPLRHLEPARPGRRVDSLPLRGLEGAALRPDGLGARRGPGNVCLDYVGRPGPAPGRDGAGRVGAPALQRYGRPDRWPGRVQAAGLSHGHGLPELGALTLRGRVDDLEIEGSSTTGPATAWSAPDCPVGSLCWWTAGALVGGRYPDRADPAARPARRAERATPLRARPGLPTRGRGTRRPCQPDSTGGVVNTRGDCRPGLPPLRLRPGREGHRRSGTYPDRPGDGAALLPPVRVHIVVVARARPTREGHALRQGGAAAGEKRWPPTGWTRRHMPRGRR
jgi:hypothetical protein